MTTTATIEANCAEVFKDENAVAFFADANTGFRRFYLSRFGDRFCIEDAVTVSRHFLPVEFTSFERLVKHVAAFLETAGSV